MSDIDVEEFTHSSVRESFNEFCEKNGFNTDYESKLFKAFDEGFLTGQAYQIALDISKKLMDIEE